MDIINVVRGKLRLDDQRLVVWNDFQKSFAGPQDLPQGKDLQILYRAIQRSDDFDAIEHILRHGDTFPGVSGFLPHVEEGGSDILLKFLSQLLDLGLDFADRTLRFRSIRNGMADEAFEPRSFALHRVDARQGYELLFSEIAQMDKFFIDISDLLFGGVSLDRKTLYFHRQLFNSRVQNADLAFQ
jgi:hypothetical protein